MVMIVIIYDHVGTGYDCDVTLAGIFSRGNFTAVIACRNECIHDCLSFLA